MSRKKKKRTKRYRPAEGIIPEQPVIHRYTAETEQGKDSRKRWKRRTIIYGGVTLLLLLILWLVF